MSVWTAPVSTLRRWTEPDTELSVVVKKASRATLSPKTMYRGSREFGQSASITANEQTHNNQIGLMDGWMNESSAHNTDWRYWRGWWCRRWLDPHCELRSCLCHKPAGEVHPTSVSHQVVLRTVRWKPNTCPINFQWMLLCCGPQRARASHLHRQQQKWLTVTT